MRPTLRKGGDRARVGAFRSIPMLPAAGLTEPVAAGLWPAWPRPPAPQFPYRQLPWPAEARAACWSWRLRSAALNRLRVRISPRFSQHGPFRCAHLQLPPRLHQPWLADGRAALDPGNPARVLRFIKRLCQGFNGPALRILVLDVHLDPSPAGFAEKRKKTAKFYRQLKGNRKTAASHRPYYTEQSKESLLPLSAIFSGPQIAWQSQFGVAGLGVGHH